MMSPGLAIMENGKDPVCAGNSRPGDGGLEARFEDLCKSGLSLDDETYKQALRLLQQSKNMLFAFVSSIGGGSAEEIERFWFACVLFSVRRLSVTNVSKEEQDGKSGELNFGNILRANKLNVMEFCREMPQFFLRAAHVLSNMYGADWQKRLEVKEFQEDLWQLIILSNFYKGAYRKFFLRSERNTVNQAFAGSTGQVPEFHRFGWLLFLLLRIHVFSRFKDLVTCATGLVSVLGFLILHVPVRFRNFSFNDVSLFAKKSEKGVDLISSLCETYQTSEDDLKKTMENAKRLVMDIFKKMPSLASEHKAENLDDINTDGLFYFEDLMNNESISSSLLILEKNYSDAFSSKSGIDERMFIDEDESLLGPASFSGGSMNLSGIKRNFDSLSSPVKSAVCPRTPLRASAASPANGKLGGINLKMAPTPVSTAMTTVKWLRTVISPLPSKPSAALEVYFSSCDRDVTHEVVYRAHVILAAIFPSSHGEQAAPGSVHITNLMDSIWADKRKMEALKLYYRVLEAICSAESKLLHGNNLTSLLSNERFHRCMLACSAELILATYKTTSILFPAVLEKTGITAFDLSKVIESFVRHEGSLPRELKRHLNSLEERLLESMAWEKGLSLYNSLIIARPNLAAEISRQGLLAEPMPSVDAIAVQHNVSNGCLPPLVCHKTMLIYGDGL